jgi:hypothetical protein
MTQRRASLDGKPDPNAGKQGATEGEWAAQAQIQGKLHSLYRKAKLAQEEARIRKAEYLAYKNGCGL